MAWSQVSDILKNFYKTMDRPPKIEWQRLPGLKLQAYVSDIEPRGFERGLRETDMDPVQEWTDKCNCGRRLSFNVWQFKNEKQITMFLLRWVR
jgi:hypothetical protein